VRVTVNPNPNVRLGRDTVMCVGGSVTLSSSVSYAGASYLWSTGSTTSSISPTSSGNYWLRVSLNGCTARDTAAVNYKPNPTVELWQRPAAFVLVWPLPSQHRQERLRGYTWNTGQPPKHSDTFHRNLLGKGGQRWPRGQAIPLMLNISARFFCICRQ